MGERATVRDVAAAAGVSQATVSYVLNDTPGQKISEPTRRRVLDSVARLGYTPSRAARALRSGRSRVVLIAIASVPIGENIARFIETVSDTLDEHGYAVVYRRVGDLAGFRRLVDTLDPAAVVDLSSTLPAEARAWLSTRSVPLLSSGAGGETADADDQACLGRLQVTHLAGRGHTRLGWVGPSSDTLSIFAEPRLRGVVDGCRSAGLEPPTIIRTPLTRAGSVDAIASLTTAGVTGIAAYNDEVAIGLLGAALELGHAVPGDLAIIGMDNIPLSGLVTPALTTIDLHNDATARATAQRVLAALGVQGEPTADRGGATIVLRTST
ncbi:LacI family DNA-binding transcriptional regulator [Tessaracoccus defluvii]|uniref:LacI family DNA-binding transcriptional regulator n=1 Tax=Tessaracoccus defluvii TaxID=1285901 RepID=A0A7H0H648_9ACTN|nr:LacI family DNA-binding transcriptional regulator [Tessaracoccus defluvii]QNP56014.1 LacI family DNA-binding transcriptional regulator [Tessaracoccus defluvii]